MAWSLNRIPLPPGLAYEEGFTNFSLFNPSFCEDLIPPQRLKRTYLLPRVPTPHNLSMEASGKRWAHWLQVACRAAHVSFVLSRFLFL